MANEITLNLTLRVANGSLVELVNPGSRTFNQTGVGFGGGVQSIGTTEEVIDFGDVATEGWAVFQNLDGANFVTLGPELLAVMVAAVRLAPGEIGVFRLEPGVVWRAKADTAAVKLLTKVFEN